MNLRGTLQILAATLSLAAWAQDPTYPFRAEAAARPHLLIVNVAGALPDAVFAKAAEKAASAVSVNCWTNSIAKSMYRELLDKPEAQAERFGKLARIVVFVEKDKVGSSFVNAPGAWSMVNLRGLDKDGPDAAKYEERVAKMILKGMAHASGSGATLESVCAMYWASFTLDGLDKVKTVISPMAYFPMMETLQSLGGSELVTPQRDYDETVVEEEAAADEATPADAATK